MAGTRVGRGEISRPQMSKQGPRKQCSEGPKSSPVLSGARLRFTELRAQSWDSESHPDSGSRNGGNSTPCLSGAHVPGAQLGPLTPPPQSSAAAGTARTNPPGSREARPRPAWSWGPAGSRRARARSPKGGGARGRAPRIRVLGGRPFKSRRPHVPRGHPKRVRTNRRRHGGHSRLPSLGTNSSGSRGGGGGRGFPERFSPPSL
jgi:hypothetical protein